MIEITVDGKIYEVFGKDEEALNKNPHIIDKETGEVSQNQRLIAQKFLESIGKQTKDKLNTHWHIEQILKTQIQKELDKAKNYMLKTIKTENGEELVELSLDNVARVEAMINTDSNYNRQFNKEDDKHSAYWISKELKPVLFGNKVVSESYFKDTILNKIINMINIENSTHLKSDGCGITTTIDRIYENRNKLLDYLKRPIKEDTKEIFELINIYY